MGKLLIEGKSIYSSGHMYFVYVDDYGAEFVLGGTPTGTWTFGDLGIFGYEGTTYLHSSSDAREDLQGHPLTPEDRGSMTLFEGEAAQAAWDIIRQYAAAINEAAYVYDPFNLVGYNSNSVVGTLLNLIGLNPDYFIPDIGQQLPYFIGRHSLISADSEIHGSVLNDTIRLFAGNDTIWGSGGNDEFDGGEGIDTVDYSQGITAGITANMALSSGQVTNDGYGDTDTLVGIERIIGTRFADTISLIGSSKGMTINGEAGSDTIYDSIFNDTIFGGAGNDFIEWSNGADKLYGDGDIDTLSLHGGEHGYLVDIFNGKVVRLDQSNPNPADTMTFSSFERFYGSDQDDKFVFKNGTAFIDGMLGSNTIDFSKVSGGLDIDLNAGTAKRSGTLITSFDNIQNLVGTSGADHFIGESGSNHFIGGNSDDIFDGGGGADRFEGGSQIDRAGYSTSQAAVHIDLNFTVQHGGDAEGDTFISIEGAWGSNFNDTLIGSAAVGDFNWFAGLDGDDIIITGSQKGHIHGGAGDDLIVHKGGGQEMWGNEGRDTFRFEGTSFTYGGVSTKIHDFELGVDVIEFANGIRPDQILVETSGSDARIKVADFGYIVIDNAAGLGLHSGDFFYM